MGLRKNKKTNINKTDPVDLLRDRVYRDEKHIENLQSVVDNILTVLSEGKLDLFREKIYIKNLREKFRSW